MALDEPQPGQKYALEARRHIARLRRAVPGITIAIRWRPAYKEVERNEKEDQSVKLAAEVPDTREVEWLPYCELAEARSMPVPRSLANIKQDISEKKWVEARQWAGGRTSKMKYKMPQSQRPNNTVAASTKRLASRFYS